MKKELRLWLEPQEIEKLKTKARDMGFNGKGTLSHYISKVANESIIFISKDVKVILEAKQ